MTLDEAVKPSLPIFTTLDSLLSITGCDQDKGTTAYTSGMWPASAYPYVESALLVAHIEAVI